MQLEDLNQNQNTYWSHKFDVFQFIKRLWYINFLVLFSVFVQQKDTIDENINFTGYGSRIQLPDCSKLAVNWKNGNDIIIFWHDIIVTRFDDVLFLLSSLTTGANFISIASLVLELWHFPFIKDCFDVSGMLRWFAKHNISKLALHYLNQSTLRK